MLGYRGDSYVMFNAIVMLFPPISPHASRLPNTRKQQITAAQNPVWH